MEKLQQVLKSKKNIVQTKGLSMILENNRIWAAYMVQQEPNYFKKLMDIQTPKFLWIGCADSRVPANQITGLKPGQLFVHRNIANIVSPSDINVLAVIQYAVQVLKVQDIVITGHYNCGGVKACFSNHDYGSLEAWLSQLRQIRARHHKQLQDIQDDNKRFNRLVELNVKTQVLNVARIPIVQRAWKENQTLRIHGVVYRLEDGILQDLQVTKSKITDIPKQHRIID